MALTLHLALAALCIYLLMTLKGQTTQMSSNRVAIGKELEAFHTSDSKCTMLANKIDQTWKHCH